MTEHHPEYYYCMVLALIPVIVICSFIPYKIEADMTIECEGLITEKKTDKGFGTNYIFVLNSTTDIIISKTNYNKFFVGDYVIIYKSGRIELGE